MPRHPAASSYFQNFIDGPIDSVIETRIVREKALESTDFEWLFDSLANSPRSVGVSPAYSKSGSLPSLACALGNRVLVINFSSSKARGDGRRTSGARPRERRSRLEQELLCHPDCTLYSFDLATLALSLHIHFNIHLANAIDIQSALPVRSRSPVDSVRVIVSDQIFEDRIASTFETVVHGYDEQKNLDSLVQMAWLCGYLGQYDLGNTKDLFYAAPKVDTRKFSVDVSCFFFSKRKSVLVWCFSQHRFYKELHVLQKISYDAQRLVSLKPTTTTHEVHANYNPEAQQVIAQSQDYATRVTRGTRDTVRITLAVLHRTHSQLFWSRH